MVRFGGHTYSQGGLWAHLLRRVVHLSAILILWLYYQFGVPVADFFGISLTKLICFFLAIVLILEALRLYRGWTVFGQRNYEQKRISAVAWSAVGMALVLLFALGKMYTVPIICAYAIGDPLLGELRRTRLPKLVVAIIGILVISGIWWLSHIFFQTPGWLWLLMGPLTVAAEWPCLSWIDDNALMQIIPLVVVLILFIH